MSTIYKFQDSEPVVTQATSATPLGFSDPVLAYSGALGRTVQTTVGSASAMGTVTSATSLTTGTVISNFGITTIVSSTPNLAWSLAQPFTGGVYKTIFCSSTTSTGHNVTALVATIQTTGGSSGTSLTSGTVITFGQAGAYVELVSLSTASWAVIGRSATSVILSIA